MTARGPQTRRRGEARQAILRSARALFGSRGYHGTSLRDIASDAAVSEALLYRYFGSKAALFDEAVVAPYRGFVGAFLDDWSHLRDQRSNAVMIKAFVEGLYGFVREHRDSLFALVAANRFSARELGEAGVLSQEIRRLTDVTAREADLRGLASVDLEMAVSCTMALVLAMGLLDDVLLPRGADRPSDDRLLREMTRFIVGGVQQRAADDEDP